MNKTPKPTRSRTVEKPIEEINGVQYVAITTTTIDKRYIPLEAYQEAVTKKASDAQSEKAVVDAQVASVAEAVI